MMVNTSTLFVVADEVGLLLILLHESTKGLLSVSASHKLTAYTLISFSFLSFPDEALLITVL